MVSCLRFSMWSDRESNPDLIFRRDLFYPLNYQTIVRLRCAIQHTTAVQRYYVFLNCARKRRVFPSFSCIFAFLRCLVRK